MNILTAMLVISASLNVVFFYQSRNWKHDFYTKLAENNFYDSEDVQVHVERKFNRLDLLISSDQLNFQVVHDLKASEENPVEVINDKSNVENSKE